MRRANKSETDAAERMRAAGEQASQDSAAGAPSPAAADEQHATPYVAVARGHPRAVSLSATSAASISHGCRS